MGKTTTVCLLTDEAAHAVAFEHHGRRREIVARGRAVLRVPDSLLIEHDPDELADGIARAVEDAGVAAGVVNLIVPLQWCFTHVLNVTQRRVSTEALAYELEQYLPLPLEELTCAFLRLGADCVLGAAIPSQPTAELLAQLSHRGLEVEHVTVDAVAAGEAIRTPAVAPGVVLVDNRWGRLCTLCDTVENTAACTFGLRNGHDVGAAIAGQLERFASSGERAGKQWSVFDLTDVVSEADLNRRLNDKRTMRLLRSSEAIDIIGLAAAVSPPKLDLRTGPLAGTTRWDRVMRLAQQCVACAVAVLLVLACGMYLHKRSFLNQLAAVNEARRAVYREVVGEDALPPGAAVRLASERIRLDGLTRVHGIEARTGDEPSLMPLNVLRDFVVGLPEDLRVMLLDARVDDKQLSLRGQTAEHRDAERIAEAIGQVPRLSVRPPRTTRLREGGVEFSVIATGVPSDGRTADTGS